MISIKPIITIPNNTTKEPRRRDTRRRAIKYQSNLLTSINKFDIIKVLKYLLVNNYF